jgi:hypothetical protein
MMVIFGITAMGSDEAPNYVFHPDIACTSNKILNQIQTKTRPILSSVIYVRILSPDYKSWYNIDDFVVEIKKNFKGTTLSDCLFQSTNFGMLRPCIPCWSSLS